MQGITPIISIIILLLITVALAGMAFSFLQGFLLAPITKSFLIPSGGSYCVKNSTGSSIIKVYVVNTAYQSDLKASADGDFILASVDGNDASAGLTGQTLSVGESKLVLDYDCASSGCSNGYHAIDLGTSSTIQHLSIYCP